MPSQIIDNLVLPKTRGRGIKVDADDPTFGWRDITGVLLPEVNGGTAPVTYPLQGVGVPFFDATDVMNCQFHIPHDYVPGSDLFLHVHWSHHNTAITGNISFLFTSTYAKRTMGALPAGNQTFGGAKTHTITFNTTDITTTPQFVHRVDEIGITAQDPDGNNWDRDDIEVDGILLVKVTVPTIPTMSGGFYPSRIAVIHVDLHYQSTNIGTKDKVAPFWG